jgi:hypothetical protein
MISRPQVRGCAFACASLGFIDGERRSGVPVTGFPIGAAIGLFRRRIAAISALVPIAIPLPVRPARCQDLRRLNEGAFPVLQLDATAFPGNSGSPLYHPETGEVVGVINMVFVKGMKEAAISAPSGISYAVPVQPLKNLLRTVE